MRDLLLFFFYFFFSFLVVSSFSMLLSSLLPSVLFFSSIKQKLGTIRKETFASWFISSHLLGHTARLLPPPAEEAVVDHPGPTSELDWTTRATTGRTRRTPATCRTKTTGPNRTPGRQHTVCRRRRAVEGRRHGRRGHTGRGGGGSCSSPRSRIAGRDGDEPDDIASRKILRL